MRSKLTFIAAILWMGGAAPAAAGSNDAETGQVICKKRQETGTRFYTKVCRTAEQWKEMAEQHRRALAEMVNRPQIETRR